MKQRLTKKADFHSNPDIKKYEILHQTELRVQRLERIIEDLLFWKKDTVYYNQAKEEYINDYCEVTKHD
jgi:hypothetical protein|tara:strand:- start:106 stop:312 length:207 start_codon:yes stop_codon:yes gene_type:complete